MFSVRRPLRSLLSPRLQHIEQQWIDQCLNTTYRNPAREISIKILGILEKSPLTYTQITHVQAQLPSNTILAVKHTQADLDKYHSIWKPFFDRAASCNGETFGHKLQSYYVSHYKDLEEDGLGIHAAMRYLGVAYMGEVYAWNGQVLASGSQIRPLSSVVKLMERLTARIIDKEFTKHQLNFEPNSRSIAHHYLRLNPQYHKVMMSTGQEREALSQLIYATISMSPLEVEKANSILKFWNRGRYMNQITDPSYHALISLTNCGFYLVTLPRAVAVEFDQCLIKKGYVKTVDQMTTLMSQ